MLRNKRRKMRLKLTLVWLLFPIAAHAECSGWDSVYSDGGKYEFSVDKKKENYATWYHLKLVNIETGQIFPGEVVYNNGYSIPHVSFNITCTEEQKKNQKKGQEKEFCGGYSGTIYTIDGENTGYGFSQDKSMLIPKLGFDLYYACGSAGVFPVPNDIWKFKECRK